MLACSYKQHFPLFLHPIGSTHASRQTIKREKPKNQIQTAVLLATGCIGKPSMTLEGKPMPPPFPDHGRRTNKITSKHANKQANRQASRQMVAHVAIVECVACVGHQGFRLCRAPGAPTSRAPGAPCRYPYELMVQLWIFIDTHGCDTIMYI